MIEMKARIMVTHITETYWDKSGKFPIKGDLKIST